jgi:hypothetical protein
LMDDPMLGSTTHHCPLHQTLGESLCIQNCS